MMHFRINSQKKDLGAQCRVKPTARRSWMCESRYDVTQRTMADPANTQRVRGRGSGCVDRDSLESGEDEAFGGSIEARGSLRWEEAGSGEGEHHADRVELRMLGNRKSRALAD